MDINANNIANINTSDFNAKEGRIGNIIKGSSAKIEGKVKVSIQHDELDDVKVILKKDENDNIKEIKFVCSCGQTKTVILDYDE
jgi:flagellar hook protein FlgE